MVCLRRDEHPILKFYRQGNTSGGFRYGESNSDRSVSNALAPAISPLALA